MSVVFALTASFARGTFSQHLLCFRHGAGRRDIKHDEATGLWSVILHSEVSRIQSLCFFTPFMVSRTSTILLEYNCQ